MSSPADPGASVRRCVEPVGLPPLSQAEAGDARRRGGGARSVERRVATRPAASAPGACSMPRGVARAARGAGQRCTTCGPQCASAAQTQVGATGTRCTNGNPARVSAVRVLVRRRASLHAKIRDPLPEKAVLITQGHDGNCVWKHPLDRPKGCPLGIVAEKACSRAAILECSAGNVYRHKNSHAGSGTYSSVGKESARMQEVLGSNLRLGGLG